jgi:hypothetical protein
MGVVWLLRLLPTFSQEEIRPVLEKITKQGARDARYLIMNLLDDLRP